MLFFLWGVFRGKKENRLEYMSENEHPLSPRARDFPSCGDVSPDPKLHASIEFCSLLSYGAIDGDCDARVSSVDCLDGRLNCSSSTAARSFSAKQSQELRDTCPVFVFSVYACINCFVTYGYFELLVCFCKL